MGLSNDLISQFVKATNDTKKEKTEKTVYGKIVDDNGTLKVRLDGADEKVLTPIITTSNVKAGDRVIVLIKNHSATVIGNTSSPSTTVSDVEGINNKITEFETAIGGKVDTNELNAQSARIDSLNSQVVIVQKDLLAAQGNIETLQADTVEVKEKLTAAEADIDNLEATKLSVEIAEATYATITNLEAANATITDLQANYGDFKSLVSNKITVYDADIQSLKTNKLSASTAAITYANIDFSNIGQAAMEYLYSQSGLIKNVVVGEASITGQLAGVTISGDLIEANTIKAEKLVIKGSDGLYYKLNTDGTTVESEQTDQNSLNGSIILAKSVTASKINVDDLVAFDATIGGFKITGNSIYSGVKTTATNTTRGVYLDNDGQASFGDATNYLKYYKTSDGAYKLDISASSILLSTSNKNVETILNENATAISTAQSTADSAKSDISTLTTRISDAETQIDQNADDILLRATKTEVSTAKSEAISTAASDATTKANNALSSAKSYADAKIKVESDKITSAVSRISANETAISTLEQTADGLEVRLDTTDSNVATANSTANTAKTNAANAAKTATNFLSYDSTNGLLIGNKSSGSWSGARAQITSNAFNVLDQNGTTLASYGTTTTIGKTSGNNLYIDSDSIDIRKNGKVLATFDQYGLKIANTNDSSGSLGSGTTKPALVIGTATGYHIEMDNNEIMAKSNATTSSHLFLNMEGGNVSFNNNANRAMMFQEGALYAKNASFNNGDYLGILDALNDAGNTTLGYGGYNNKIGATNIYGDSVSIFSNGDLNVEASWIRCRSIAPNDHATYALGVYGEKGWSNIYLGKGDNKTNALHIINGSSTYLLCGVNSSGQYVFGNNAAVMYYQVKDVWTDDTGNAFKFTSGNNAAANNTTSVWLFGAADSTSRYVGSYLAYSRTYSSAANMVVTANGIFGRSTSSSERYKNSIVEADISELSGLYGLPVKRFKYNDDYIAPDDELYGKDLYGFIVEDLENILPCAVQHITGEDGTELPEMWNSNIIVPALLKLIQDLNNRLKVLEGKG